MYFFLRLVTVIQLTPRCRQANEWLPNWTGTWSVGDGSAWSDRNVRGSP
jgi:hypothetical protein